MIECRKSHKNGVKGNKHDQRNSINESKTDNKATNKMISAVVASAISQLSVSDNASDGEENKKPA